MRVVLVVLALVAFARSEKACNFDDGQSIVVSDNFDCESYSMARAESFRWDSIFDRIRDILDRIFPPESECPRDGVKQIEHPDSCEKYILCVGGNEVERRCGSGLYFSRKHSSCVTADVAECEESDHVWECPEEDDLNNIVFLPNTEDCQKFYLCLNGEKVPLNCGEGLHWSIDSDMCLPKKEAKCDFDDDDDDIEECPDEGIKSISHPDECEKYVLCVNGMRLKRNCSPGLHFSRDFRSCVDPEIAGCKEDKLKCPEEDDLDNLVFLADPENCGKYYVCFGGEPVQLTCADGMHWSVEKETCLEKHEAGCDDFGIEECPDQGVKSISHPDNCEKYVLCVNGNRIKRNCPPGYHFSRETRTCVEEDLADCEAGPLTCPEEHDPNNIVFLPNKEDCSMYYLCFHGEPFPLSCADGRHWSTRENACVDKDEAKCKYDDDDGVEQCPDTGIQQIPHPDDCNQFVLCVGGSRLKRSCPPDFHFSREHGGCLPQDIAGCEEGEQPDECPETDDLNNLVRLPNPENCGKYYLCFGGEQISLSCRDGTHWSVEEQDCVDKSEAGCEISDAEQCPDQGVKSISHPDSCEKYVLCVGGSRIKRSCPPGFHFSRESRNCVAPEIADCEEIIECPETDDGGFVFIPNPDYCNKFYFCFGGTPIPMTCADGLHWSAEDETCTSKKLAGCDDSENGIEECPEKGVKSISHPYDCGQYVLCVNGNRIKRNCPDGLHFSIGLRRCTTPEDAECKKLSCPKEDDLDNLVMLPNTENCGEFYICFGGDKFPMSCGDGLHWSVEEQDCLKPSLAECEFDSFEQCPDEGIDQISHPETCDKYILCVGGARIEQRCAPGFHFSRAFRSCVQPEFADCEI